MKQGARREGGIGEKGKRGRRAIFPYSLFPLCPLPPLYSLLPTLEDAPLRIPWDDLFGRQRVML